MYVHICAKFSVHSRRGRRTPYLSHLTPECWCVFEHMCQVTGGDGVSVAALRVFPADSQVVIIQLTHHLSHPQCYNTMHQSLGVEYS